MGLAPPGSGVTEEPVGKPHPAMEVITIMGMSRDEVFQKVQGVLVDALGVDDDEVTPEATLMGDLGAESIDFLDIVFRLEKAFGMKVPREELFPAEGLLNNPELISNGKFTDKGLGRAAGEIAPHGPDRLRERPQYQQDRRSVYGQRHRQLCGRQGQRRLSG